MHEPLIQLRHLDKLKGQAPRPFLRYARIADETEAMPSLHKISLRRDTHPFLMLLPLFLFFSLLGVGGIWLLPLDEIYHVVLTLLFLLFEIGAMSYLEMTMKRWSTPNTLMTQRVPAIKGDPLRVFAQDLGEDTNVYLERITR